VTTAPAESTIAGIVDPRKDRLRASHGEPEEQWTTLCISGFFLLQRFRVVRFGRTSSSDAINVEEDAMKDDANHDFAEQCDAVQARLADIAAALTELRATASAELAEQAAIIERQTREIAAKSASLEAAKAALNEERVVRCEAEQRLHAELELRAELRGQLFRLASTLDVAAPAPDPESVADPVGESGRGRTDRDSLTAAPDATGIAADIDLASRPPPVSPKIALQLVLPEDLATACHRLVTEGAAPDMAAAAMELIRRGVQVPSASAKSTRRRIRRE